MKIDSGYSRRKFLRVCALGTGGIAAWSVLGKPASLRLPVALPRGPSALTIPLNRGWRFGGKLKDVSSTHDGQWSDSKQVSLPHCVADLSWRNWEPDDWEEVWVYRRRFDIPFDHEGGRVFMKFNGVMVGATPSINGHELPRHLGGYLPFEYEITDLLKKSGNALDLKVDSRWSNVPPEGSPEGPKRIDYLEPGGIHRDVSIRILPEMFIRDAFAKPVNVLGSDRAIEIECTIDTSVVPDAPVTLSAQLQDGPQVISRAAISLSIDRPGRLVASLRLSDIGNLRLWDVDLPALYHIRVVLSVDGKPVHDYNLRTGLREARFENDGFFLNGRRLRIFGLNRHELFPYSGYAMPEKVMRRDAEILRSQLHCNMVRCSHYPQSESFLDACDELGLMAWEEVPGWGYIGDESWKDLLIRDVGDMIVRDRNHPSVVIWGTRVNESPNEVELYKKTRAIAKSLDDSRPSSGTMTSGSRKTWTTSWSEDVFAYDDYHADETGGVGIEEPVKGFPYLITEAVGQFNYRHPKEGFNAKYRRAGDISLQRDQAIWHAQAHDRAAANKRISGVIAWCAFDYGSLINSYENVKCPGVADIFRIPKLGATFYMSQVEPTVSPVICPDFYWDFGAQTPSGPGKHSAIFSNCERLELFVNGRLHSTVSPDSKAFPNLKYPPFFADLEMSGEGNPLLRIDGYVSDRLIVTKSFSSDHSKDKFHVKTDEREVRGDGSDSTRLGFMVTDEFGEPRAFAGGMVSFTLAGPGSIIGDNPFDLGPSGGVGAVWIRSNDGGHGVIRIKAEHSSLGAAIVEVSVSEIAPDPTLG